MTTDRALPHGQSQDYGQSLSRVQRHRLLQRILLRSFATVALLTALYYLGPMQDLQGVHVALSLSVGLVILVFVVVFQVRSIIQSQYPVLRAVEALAVSAPLFLLMFASAYFILAQDAATNFNPHQLTRTDSLYFTLTTFATVGFGDIVATSQTARLFVSTQMVLDLLILGLGVQVYRSAIQTGRKRSGAGSVSRPEGKQPPDQAKGTQP